MPDIPTNAIERKILEGYMRAFRAGEKVYWDDIRDFVPAGWERSAQLEKEGVRFSLHCVSAAELSRRKRAAKLLLECCHAVMESVYKLMAGIYTGKPGIPCVLFVADRERIVLECVGSSDLVVRPGLCMSETVCGSNAVDACLNNAFIATTWGRENYSEFFWPCVFSASPVITADGTSRGAFCVGMRAGDYTVALKAACQVAARAVASLLDVKRERQRSEILIEQMEDGLVCVDDRLVVTYCNKSICKMFPNLRRGRPLFEQLSFSKNMASLLEKGAPCHNEYVRVRGDKGHSANFYATITFEYHEGMIFLRKAGRVRELAVNVTSSGAQYTFEDILGSSQALHKTIGLAKRAATRDLPILLTGESGTGKELFAHAIHRASTRAERPFVIVNCGALPQSLIQSELFGYEEGAFTGALSGHMGKFELAHTGTLFLDEIGELPLDVQSNLLRFLQSGEIGKLGATEMRHVDVRVIAATNRDLLELVRTGRFREDLYFRLNVFPIHIPPLRERAGDALVLARAFAAHFSKVFHGREIPLSGKAEKIIAASVWPGNVRQLENFIQLHASLAEGDTIEVTEPRESAPVAQSAAGTGFVARSRDFEKTLMEDALARCGGSSRKAMALLGMSSSTFYYKLRKYGIGRAGTGTAKPATVDDIVQLLHGLPEEALSSLANFLMCFQGRGTQTTADQDKDQE